MNRECDKLDDYLADDMPVGQSARFEQHLQQCDVCREAVDQQRWINGLLQSPIRLQVEPTPAGLVELANNSKRQHYQRMPLAACGLAAAAMLFVGWLLNRQTTDDVDHHATRVSVVENEPKLASASRNARFVGDGDIIAVPIESRHSDVTIVRIYPTYLPPYESQTVSVEPGSASELAVPDYFNGG